MHADVATRTAATVLVDQLRIQGTSHVFCVPGKSYLPVLDALHDSGIKIIICRHEGGASMMAEAYGKQTGRPGICFVTRGPGATNASGGVHIAQQDSTPMILFVGQVERENRGRDAFQEMDFRTFFGGLAKWVAEVSEPERMGEMVGRAFSTALAGRQGPVVLSLPHDMLSLPSQSADAPFIEAVETAPGSARDSGAGRTARGKPASHADPGRRALERDGAGRDRAIRGNASASRFAPPSAAPIISIRSHPNYAGDLGLAANPRLVARVKASDLVIAAGARLNELTSQGYTLFDIPDPQMKLVHAYPGAEELGRVYRPHLAIHAAPKAFAEALAGLKPRRAAHDVSRGASGLSRLVGKTPAPARRRQSVGNHGLAARPSAGRRHHLQRRGQLFGLDPPLLSFPPLQHPDGHDLRLHGLWHAGRGVDEGALSANARGRHQWRWRFPDERPGAGHRRAIRTADHRAGAGQFHPRHHPHASGTRISWPGQRHRSGQSGFRRHGTELWRIWRHGGKDRGLRASLPGSRGLRPCHPSFM